MKHGRRKIPAYLRAATPAEAAEVFQKKYPSNRTVRIQAVPLVSGVKWSGTVIDCDNLTKILNGPALECHRPLINYSFDGFDIDEIDKLSAVQFAHQADVSGFLPGRSLLALRWPLVDFAWRYTLVAKPRRRK